MQALRAEPASFAKVGMNSSVSAPNSSLCRLVFVKRLTACAKNAGISETTTHLMPLFKKLSADTEVVIRQAVATEMGNLSLWLANPTEVTSPRISMWVHSDLQCLRCLQGDSKDADTSDDELDEIL